MAARQPAERSLGRLVLVAPTPAPTAARRSGGDDHEADDEGRQRGEQPERLIAKGEAEDGGDRDECQRDRPALPANRRTRTVTVALRSEPFRAVTHLISPWGAGRACGA